MKGLILVGGYGTRLRPLTLSVPKPLIHFCNKPIVEYQIRALVELGVKHVILAVAYQPDAMKDALRRLETKYNIRISCSIEDEPLLTAGPIRLAESMLMEREEGEQDADLFYVFNSDIIAEYPLKEMLKFHKQHGKEGTICLTKVKDPSLFGVVLSDPVTGQISRFIEKPQEWINDDINAGIYLFNTSMIRRIEHRPVSIEKEIFPRMCQDGQLYSYQLPGYWADIGKPRDFLDGTRLYLQALQEKQSSSLAVSRPSAVGHCPVGRHAADPPSGETTTSPSLEACGKDKPPDAITGSSIIGNVLIHPSASVGDDCQIGPDVTIGQNCVIKPGCRISNTALMADVTIESHTKIDQSIIGWNSRVGSWVRIDGLTVLGQNVKISKEVHINGAFVLPHKVINTSITEPGQIIM
ncbi:mannose-1-phosphate guanyltransferase beta [Gregarina niphandrodes]|uniref:mannose-1-phosphate guanylyltransferase n=1 Tax=Gregarina niphandrodes TaxID=110365 RepID=A0A023B626_GRENI|nr:mannose-1-phosphate guanyltransferase beta [Gregarina niphandrodes]EZG65034.1 mannose-1-phosphate guanyltransferase beta [Gregarina niphandrodes]|eukprot:XP_011134110.1 mannose-1-phosphate guanyltransferase beta [Gregarina niphandrodes]